MEPPPTPKNKWVLTQDAFELLLSQLASDRDQAGDKYELLRRKLVKFFEWRRCASPEDLADETLNRIARNLESGEKIRDFGPYCAGIARRVFLEHLRQREHERSLQAMPAASGASVGELERRATCLETCMRALTPDSRQLILDYYQEEKHARIEARKVIAAQLGIPLNALRIRAYRIRAQLEQCVHHCMSSSGEE